MPRSPLRFLVALALWSCPALDERPPEPDAGQGDEPVQACGAYEIPAGQIDASLPWPSLACSDFPALCGLQVEKTVGNPQTAKALDIAFVGEGFTVEQLPEYRGLVSGLIGWLTSAPDGLAARRPALFNFYRVDLASRSSRVGNSDRTDTALAGCVDIARSGNLVVDERLAGLAATAAAGVELDLVVVVMRTLAGTPNASAGPVPGRPALVRLNPLASSDTLHHELGHALFHLGDEYATEPACYTPPDLPAFTTADYLFDFANLSTEETGSKWAALHQGAKAGGMGYRYCLYHPGAPCLMNEGTLPFCPVCSAAVEQTLDAWEGKDDGPPRCGIELSLLPSYVHGSVELRAVVFDRNAPTRHALRVDGAEVGQGEVAGWHQRVASVLDSTRLANGAHTLSLECRDALGTTSLASVEIRVQN